MAAKKKSSNNTLSPILDGPKSQPVMAKVLALPEGLFTVSVLARVGFDAEIYDLDNPPLASAPRSAWVNLASKGKVLIFLDRAEATSLALDVAPQVVQ